VTVVKPYIGERDRDITHTEFAYVRYINHAVTAFVVIGIVLAAL
jgi:hypothetical protein